ncbi:hypothetical protein [Methylocystis bryophila]|uniref:Uncharacterized protein n=1 Tax=Methylocystis bryophila TaxID=655015 RepID=A0A1W6MV21_9HYPH|nr:hypothetical protein [Methylocystis bryophila]ARN81366.1 hypothetical protein B1812_10075 [Methylocystis bryophila]BDV37354.1 hypothetical protein DSM21852_06070 [Methylocystis bryophila]
MTFAKLGAALLVAFMGCSAARAADASFRCEGVNQTTGAQLQPFTIGVRGKTVTLDGVEGLGKSFSLIQQDAHFIVFKNGAKTQGGNIDRTSMTISLYVLDMGKHKLAVQIGGRCAAQ